MPSWELTVFGAVGGAIPDLLRLFALRREDATPDFVTGGVVWLGFSVPIWLGAWTAHTAHSTLEANVTGYACPQLLSKLLSDRHAERQPLAAYRLGIPGVWRIQRWWAF